MSKVPEFQFEDYPPAKPAKIANLQPVEAPTLENLVTLAGGNDENQFSHPSVGTPQASGKPISICPQCQGGIFLRTSSGRKFCYQCLYEMNDEVGVHSTGFNEVDWVLKEGFETAQERSAIMEYDGGLQRKQADETARRLHIQPAIEELLRQGLIAIEEGAPGAQLTTIPGQALDHSPPAKVANLYPTETAQASAPERILSCNECPWYQLNPWTHYPDFGAWCHYRINHLVVDSAACEEFQHGEVPPRQNMEK